MVSRVKVNSEMGLWPCASRGTADTDCFTSKCGTMLQMDLLLWPGNGKFSSSLPINECPLLPLNVMAIQRSCSEQLVERSTCGTRKIDKVTLMAYFATDIERVLPTTTDNLLCMFKYLLPLRTTFHYQISVQNQYEMNCVGQLNLCSRSTDRKYTQTDCLRQTKKRKADASRKLQK